MPIDTHIKQWVESLDDDRCYELKEELRSGEFVTHGTSFTKTELLQYVTSIWIDSVPPEFVICGK